MDATQTLREEHQLILKVLTGFESALNTARESRIVARIVFDPFIEFFRGFADRCHHGKEEDKLFPCLQRCGMPGDCGPIAVMLHEHQQGRLHVRCMADGLAAAESGSSAAMDAFLQHGFAFLQLLRDHIGKEDHVLFQIADEIVIGDALSNLSGAYGDVERDNEYREVYARCKGIADRLTTGDTGAASPDTG